MYGTWHHRGSADHVSNCLPRSWPGPAAVLGEARLLTSLLLTTTWASHLFSTLPVWVLRAGRLRESIWLSLLVRQRLNTASVFCAFHLTVSHCSSTPLRRKSFQPVGLKSGRCRQEAGRPVLWQVLTSGLWLKLQRRDASFYVYVYK